MGMEPGMGIKIIHSLRFPTFMVNRELIVNPTPLLIKDIRLSDIQSMVDIDHKVMFPIGRFRGINKNKLLHIMGMGILGIL